MKRFLWGLVAAALLAVPANAFEFGFEGAKSATAAELNAETGLSTKYPQWVQGRVEAGQRDWFWDHCSAYIEKMGLQAFTNVNKCLGAHYRVNGERSLDRINPGDVFWMVDLGSDPAAVQAAFTEAAEAEAKAAADAAIAPYRDALLSNEEFRAGVAAILEGSAEGVNPWTTPEELEGLRAELFAELEKLGTGPTAEDLEVLIGTLLDERGYITANVDAAVATALEASDLTERLTALEGRMTTAEERQDAADARTTVIEGSLANLTETVNEQGKVISNITVPDYWYWLVGLTAASIIGFVLMGFGYFWRRPRWKRLTAVEERVDVVSQAALEAGRVAGEAKAEASAAHVLAKQAFELTFDGMTINGALPDFAALSVGGVANVSLINFEGAEAVIGFERVEHVSADDPRPGLKVTGVNGQTNPLPLDSGIHRRVVAMLARAARNGKLDFSRLSTVLARMKGAAPAPNASPPADGRRLHLGVVDPAA